MREFLRENSWPVLGSVVLHALLAIGAVLMAYLSGQQHLPSVQPAFIDAVVVDSKALLAAQKVLADRAQEQLARARDAAAAKMAEEAKERDAALEARQSAAAAAEEAAKAQALSAANAKAAANTAAAAAEARKASEARQVAEAKRAEEEAREAVAARAAAADAKRAEDKRTEDKRAEDKRNADAKRAAEERARADREAELRRQLADEEHVSAIEAGPLRDKYIAMLRNKIQNAWIKPASAAVGLNCLVEVTQVPGGEVTGARVTQCNGDGGVRQSIENAVYRASPLPDPPDPALFERKITLRFVPDE